MSEYLDYITDVNDVQDSVNDLALKMYKQGRADALKTIDEYKTLTNSDKVFIVNDEWVKSITEQIKADAIAEFKDLGKLYSEIRADVIDECIKALDEYSEFPMTDEYVIIPMTDEYVIKECIRVLGQLKEQKNLTCFDCEHHFMSDCYLECNKHNRINDNKICDDFEQLKEQK